MAAALAAIIILDIFTVGNTKHRIMRFVKVGLCKTSRIGGNQRQIAVIGHRDQRFFSRNFDGIATTGQFDIEPIRKHGL